MKNAIFYICLCVVVAGCTSNNNLNIENTNQKELVNLNGSWDLKVKNDEREIITSMIIQFSDEKAKSCLEGNWKRAIVKSRNTSDKKFFPVYHPLSYTLEGSVLTIGHNEVCNAYAQLSGKVKDYKVSGEFIGFGPGWTKYLGYFTLNRSSN